MHLSLVNYQTNLNQNKLIAFKASPVTTKITSAATDVIKKTAESLPVAPIGGATIFTLGVLKYQNSDITSFEHNLRVNNAIQKFKDSGFSNPDYNLHSYQFMDLSYMTGNCFDSIIDDFIQINKGVEEGQPVKEYVDLKLKEIMTKYNLPEKAKNRSGYTNDVMSEIRNVFMGAWKNEANYKIACGVKKDSINDSVFRKQCKPDEKVLERFDDLLTRVGNPIETKEYGNNITEYTYLNKYGDKIVVTDDKQFRAIETLYVNEPEGIEHTIRKEYYLGGDKFIDIADETNGAVCGSRGAGASGITEYTKIGNDTETIKYDDWGIKEKQVNTEKTDNKEIISTTKYAGDGSILKVITEETYLS